jgi:hypothetical protein
MRAYGTSFQKRTPHATKTAPGMGARVRCARYHTAPSPSLKTAAGIKEFGGRKPRACFVLMSARGVGAEWGVQPWR